jgi:hypothetical protein
MKTLSTAIMSALALACATLAAYCSSILWRGAWVYRVFLAPISGATMAAILLLAIVAFIRRCLTTALTVGCGLGAAAIFFAVLDNCRLSCEPTIESRMEEPDRELESHSVLDKLCFSRKILSAD